MHPAYTNPDGTVVQAWKSIKAIASPVRGDVPSGDVGKAVTKIYDLTLLPEPPLRLVLGKDAIASTRKQAQMVTNDVNSYESWSDDFMED